jgi:hypothetical protein
MQIGGWICLGTFLLAPFITFAIGYQLGKRGLPYKLVKVEDDDNYAVEV